HPQLSSCFLTTIEDDLHSIFMGIYNNAMLSKWSGGLGNDWTPVRALGSHIRGTNGRSQGVIPFLKVANDTAIAVNQGGKRRGAYGAGSAAPDAGHARRAARAELLHGVQVDARVHALLEQAHQRNLIRTTRAAKVPALLRADAALGRYRAVDRLEGCVVLHA